MQMALQLSVLEDEASGTATAAVAPSSASMAVSLPSDSSSVCAESLPFHSCVCIYIRIELL